MTIQLKLSMNCQSVYEMSVFKMNFESTYPEGHLVTWTG